MVGEIVKLAELVTEYCIGVKKHDEILITGSYVALPLVRELVRSIVIRGGYPIVMFSEEELEEVFMKYADKEVLTHVSPIEEFILKSINARISILSSTHTKYLSSIDPERIKLRSSARRKLTEIFMQRDAEGELRWCVAPYPTKALAQEAEMSLIDYVNFVYKACMVDKEDPIKEWQEFTEYLNKIEDKILSKADEIHIVADDTDLRVKVGNRTWIVDDGKKNMPGGEIFTGPVEDSVEGVIRFTYPAVWRGITVEDVKLKFKRGEVVDAHASKGEEFLRKVLEIDDGSKRVGEFAFGLNYNIARFTKAILFDEKIGGTIHMALGAGYPITGSKNVSAIHWDMIKDMRRGKVYIDGDLVYENGKFLEDVL